MDSALAFWLSYIESRGGLWERSGDSALVMIPPQLQRSLGLAEEFAVTEHADVAREDGVTLLGAGHPLLMTAAEDVLSADDAGVLRLAVPAAGPPDGERLLEKAREAFPVDHGRIDAGGPVDRCVRQVLRVGAMVTYTASADDRFCERAECWVDVPSRQELPEQAVKRMRRLAADGSPAGAAPDLGAVPPALAAAHRLLDQAAAGRCGVLANGSVRAAADTELARTKKYYAEALASLARRQGNAAPDRQALLAARMDSVRICCTSRPCGSRSTCCAVRGASRWYWSGCCPPARSRRCAVPRAGRTPQAGPLLPPRPTSAVRAACPGWPRPRPGSSLPPSSRPSPRPRPMPAASGRDQRWAQRSVRHRTRGRAAPGLRARQRGRSPHPQPPGPCPRRPSSSRSTTRH